MFAGALQHDNLQHRIDSMLNERGLIILGYGIVLSFVTLFFLWGSLVPLSSAAIAPGTVGVAGANKIVQHPVGGVVNQILVDDGDLVNQGDVLILLDSVKAESEMAALDLRWVEQTADRLLNEALLHGSTTLTLPSTLQNHPLAEKIRVALSNHQTVLSARTELLRQSRTRLERNLDTINAEILAAKGIPEQLQSRFSLVEGELAEFRRLAKAGMVTRSQVFELEKERDDILARIDNTESEVVILTKRRAALQAEIKELENTAKTNAAVGADVARRDAADTDAQRTAAAAVLEQLAIRAPISGTVTALSINTVGGVVKAGDAIMEIVPDDGQLLVTSRVDPRDRDAVAIGQSASVRFSAFDRRSSLPVEGEVVLISADSLTDPITKQTYYRTLIAMNDVDSALPTGARIVPGMQAEVLISTGEQTLVDYLLAPVLRSFNRAMRED